MMCSGLELGVAGWKVLRLGRVVLLAIVVLRLNDLQSHGPTSNLSSSCLGLFRTQCH